MNFLDNKISGCNFILTIFFIRLLAHNGEINTLRGNVNLMKAREGVMSSPDFGENLNKLYPVVNYF
jgi:glutamate synthase domain-containing protein 1